MEIFTLVGLGVGLGYAWLLPRLMEPDQKEGDIEVSRNRRWPDGEQPSVSTLSDADGKTCGTAATTHGPTELLTEDESKLAAEALRSALAKRR